MRGWFLIEFNNLVASTEHLNCCWLLASPKVQFDYAMLLQRDARADGGLEKENEGMGEDELGMGMGRRTC